MVLKLPLTRAASAKGLQRKSGLPFAPGEDGRDLVLVIAQIAVHGSYYGFSAKAMSGSGN